MARYFSKVSAFMLICVALHSLHVSVISTTKGALDMHGGACSTPSAHIDEQCGSAPPPQYLMCNMPQSELITYMHDFSMLLMWARVDSVDLLQMPR